MEWSVGGSLNAKEEIAAADHPTIRMFNGATSFNGDLSAWDVSAVTNMISMFYNANAFNGDLSAWDVSAVTDMESH